MQSATTLKETITPLQRFFRLLALDRKEIGYIYLYAVFSGLITLSVPLGVQAIIGLIAGGSVSTSLIILILIVTIGTALTGILRIMQLIVTESIQRRIFARSAFDFAYRLPNLKVEKLIMEYPPELVNRFFDTLTIQKGLPKILTDFSTSILQIIFGLLLLAFYHPFFVFFGLGLLTILALIFYLTGPQGLTTSLKESKYKYMVAYWLEEVARTMSTFKLAGTSNLPVDRTDDRVVNYLDARKKHFRVLLVQFGSIAGFKIIVTGGLLLLGSILVIDNQINIGQFVAAEIIVILVMNSAEKLIMNMDTIYDMLTALEKIGQVTDLQLEKTGGMSFEDIDTGCGLTVNIENLSYQYADAEKPVLDDISIDIECGEHVCIAGYNSSGKSTLIQIIAGIYNEFTGSIAYNGFPLRNINMKSLRQHIGDYNSQEDIFAGTIYDNISIGHSDCALDDVVRAADDVGLSSFIRSQPDGFNTRLLPGGRNIPRNIRAKILLARSIASNPRLLAMEEIFNNLDPEDRIRVSELVTDKERNWSLVAITDDPVLASRCDRVIILKDGKILEQGPFQQIRKSIHYSNVFKTERPSGTRMP